ncbi:MAG: hydroxymethylbilane synthase [Actinomycetota bacterium]|nr:hydroxymethylbilane synthase [Actinomycetota bacterium]
MSRRHRSPRRAVQDGAGRIVVASRRSPLALTQSEGVAQALRDAHPGLDVEVLPVRTRGDADRRPFASIGGKGLFVAEVEQAVVDGRADIAVHSAKDLTAQLAPGCSILAVPPRAPGHDVVVGATGDSGHERLGALAPGAVVGTSSMRRRALLAEARPDLEAVELRGNIETRLRKVAAGEVDAAILAAAGLERLGIPSGTGAPLDDDWWVPAPGQGALAVEARTDRVDLHELLAPLNDASAAAELACERAFSARLEGGCSVPLGCLARSSGGRMTVAGYLGSPYGDRGLRDRISGPLSAAAELGRELADAIYAAGGREVLEELRDADPPAPAAP